MCKLGDIVIANNKSYIVIDIMQDKIDVINYEDFTNSLFDNLITCNSERLQKYDYIFGRLNDDMLIKLVHLVYERK